MTVAIIDNAALGQFELLLEGKRVGVLQYRRTSQSFVLTHTEINLAQRGQGYGGQLVEAAVVAARDEGRRLKVVCPYAKTWLLRHPDAGD